MAANHAPEHVEELAEHLQWIGARQRVATSSMGSSVHSAPSADSNTAVPSVGPEIMEGSIAQWRSRVAIAFGTLKVAGGRVASLLSDYPRKEEVDFVVNWGQGGCG